MRTSRLLSREEGCGFFWHIPLLHHHAVLAAKAFVVTCQLLITARNRRALNNDLIHVFSIERPLPKLASTAAVSVRSPARHAPHPSETDRCVLLQLAISFQASLLSKDRNQTATDPTFFVLKINRPKWQLTLVQSFRGGAQSVIACLMQRCFPSALENSPYQNVNCLLLLF